MKKRELIHFHSLLGAIAKELSERGELTESDLTDYEEIGVTPMTMRASRNDHEEAVIELAATLDGAVSEEIAEEAESQRSVAL